MSRVETMPITPSLVSACTTSPARSSSSNLHPINSSPACWTSASIRETERAFVPFTYGENIKPSSEDEVVLFVNNMGGMSVLEMYAVVDETISQLENLKLNIRVRRSYCGSFMTSLNAPGFSIALWNLAHNSRLVAASEKEDLKPEVSFLLSLVDALPGAAAWPSSVLVRHDDDERAREEKFVKRDDQEASVDSKREKDLRFLNLFHLRHIIRAAALEVFAAEPDLTKWDTIVGDGDCGETCANGAKAVLKALDEGLGNDGELVSVLRELTEIIDDTCGGTLGTICSIFLAALTAEVRALAPSTPNAPPPPVDIAFWGLTASRAIETLKLSTKARGLAKAAEDSSTKGDVGDEKAAFAKAEEACRVGGEGTASLKVKLGRATYVGGDGDVALPPDPSVMSLVALARGVGKALRGEK
ncbi:hypothetical protein V5O48_018084 [Marasmius crinis-equi]|uniref:Dihydroxyacetone kinase n=1 Tax=Marasmius crinis-equi TaxID=585013 RepID=A0ABR3EM77_9AGAR